MKLLLDFLGVDNPRRRYDNSSLLSSVVFFVSESMNKKTTGTKIKSNELFRFNDTYF